jgi:phosphoribosylamine--glycine ligase
MNNILLVGSGAREHAIARAIDRSPQHSRLFCFGSSVNPGINELCEDYFIGSLTNIPTILKISIDHNIHFAIIGPEAPLAAGVSDGLWKENIPCIGPKKRLAQIETSKAFTRDLLTKYNIPVSPLYRVFNKTLEGANLFLQELGDFYVVKYDGLMGGKGVRVAGDHLHSHAEALDYCKDLVEMGGSFVIEQKLVGQEFSLMSFCDGEHLLHMPPVQDHKRAYDGDKGPNTGGMGSYSDVGGGLPFLTRSDVDRAQQINEMTSKALKDEFNEGYIGVLYGGFILTAQGVRLIEYNARFGDPEAMNVLAILKSDFLEICRNIISGELDTCRADFGHEATVCKYAVPEGYPDKPVKGRPIDVSSIMNDQQLYYASVDMQGDQLVEAGSRTVAVVGVADSLGKAEATAESEISRVNGPLFHRKDIGTEVLINKRIDQMRKLRSHVA